MLPMAAAGLAQGIFGVGQALFGASKLKASKKAAQDAIKNIQTQEVDPLVAARYNMPMPGEQEAKMDISQAATASVNQAKNLKSGLKMIGQTEAQRIKGLQGLQKQKAQYKLGAEQALVGQKEKAFKSRQEKQQLMANIALQDVAAQRSNITQGLSGLASGIGNIGMAGGLGKGMFGKKSTVNNDPYSGVEI